jgi:hypothetical protein
MLVVNDSQENDGGSVRKCGVLMDALFLRVRQERFQFDAAPVRLGLNVGGLLPLNTVIVLRMVSLIEASVLKSQRTGHLWQLPIPGFDERAILELDQFPAMITLHVAEAEYVAGLWLAPESHLEL